MTNPDYRALCANLTAALNDWQCETGDDRYEGLLARARALLAQEAVGPSEKELYDLFCEYEREPVESMRAALARWGRPTPQPPADMEVGKPVAWMCPAESYWDGKEWQPRWQVTTDQKLAEYWARPDKPTPLFANALPTPEATND